MKNLITANFKNLTTIVVLGAFALSGAGALARSTGEVKWRDEWGPDWGQPDLKAHTEDGHTYVTHPTYQGSQGTYWVWRWQKVYPEFITYCSAATCTAGFVATKTESVEDSWAIDVSPNHPFSYLASALSVSYRRSYGHSQSFAFNNTVTLNRGQNAYGGVIALDKYIPGADIRGVWEPTGQTHIKYCKSETCRYGIEYRWDNNKTVGVWKGHRKTHHRTFLCTTRTVVSPRVGETPPPGCTLPHVPY